MRERDPIDEMTEMVGSLRKDVGVLVNFMRLADYASHAHHVGDDEAALRFLEDYRSARMEHAEEPPADG